MAKRPHKNMYENKMIRSIDKLAEFDAFADDILPILKKAIDEGWTTEQLYGHPKTQALLAARAITIGVMGEAGHALSAIKDVLDRTKGKAVERKIQVHKYADLKDEEIDALLASEEQTVVD